MDNLNNILWATFTICLIALVLSSFQVNKPSGTSSVLTELTQLQRDTSELKQDVKELLELTGGE